ncbi:RDD family protein [Streptomyces sp. NPDC052052]|uniref:RDD family protein n=1 Tax=Streptomyces sp. NPDC052052 TaxID=3154756 RepID=UPI00341DBAD8
MSAPTPAPGDESPREGYYPDPSIPGYVRYWNGASWVPGTSRPAPQQDDAMPATPSGATAESQPQPSVPDPVEETGPVFLDGRPSADDRPEPATAWQADASRQTGFGGDLDRRVSWGGTGEADGPGGPDQSSEQGPGPGAGTGTGSVGDPRTPADGPQPGVPADRVPADRVPSVREPADRALVDRVPAVREPADRAPVDPRRPASADLTGRGLPGAGDRGGQVPENTVALRADRPGRGGEAAGPSTEGTVTIRAVGRDNRSRPSAPAPAAFNGPPTPGSGTAPWAQQAHPLTQPDQAVLAQQQQPQPQPSLPFQGQQQPHAQHAQLGVQGGQPDQPVVPWKPPVNDPFQQLAQAQASARPAGLGKRLVARLVDTVVLGALVGAISFPLVSRAVDHIDEKISAAKLSGETVTVWLIDSTTAGLLGGVLGAFLVLGVLLETLPTVTWGRTLGKKLCGLHVRDIESHEFPPFGAALRRWLVHGVLGILLIGVVDVLWCVFDRPWRQCWHDKAAHTFVAD